MLTFLQRDYQERRTWGLGDHAGDAKKVSTGGLSQENIESEDRSQRSAVSAEQKGANDPAAAGVPDRVGSVIIFPFRSS